MKSATFVIVLALLLLALIKESVQQSDGVCYRSVARYVPQRRFRTESFVAVYYVRCGWFGWSNCIAYRTNLRRVPFYVSVMTYNLRSFCCTGYLGNANEPDRCIAQCTRGCFNGGYCGTPETCVCNSGWGGTDCTEDINECNDTSTCAENQVCFNTAGSHLCECNLGYERDPDSGTTSPGVYLGCKDIDECSGFHGCSHMCENLNGTYRCLCDTGYIIQADERQCQDVNECLDNNGGCSDNCTNTDGSYYCSCFSGFQLSSDNHTCEDIKECINGMNERCEERCIELEGGFRCGCNDGRRLRSDNVSCEDVNECEEGISGCQQLCNYNNGSYHCDCYSGYLLKEDRHMCEDDNECEVNNGGCSQNCTNTLGSYMCSCEEGYTLDFDGFSCSGQSCLSLMTPRNGNYTCDGPQITGTVCTFECDLGYNLVGSERRECLRNNEWSGNTTSCEILHCEVLDGPENGDVVLPCYTRLGSICSVECSSGFYTNSTTSFQECQVTPDNIAIWSEPPQCIERELCFPNPCQHGGICSLTEDTFTCDCDSTGYTGEMCDVLLINTPDVSALMINSPMNFSLFARPDRTFELELVPDNKAAIVIMPSSVMFSKVLTQHKISITAKTPGFYKLEYKVKDDSINYQPIPPATILVGDNDTGISYCESRNITCGLIQPGCCSANENQLNLEFKCPSSDSELLLKSTCGWVTKPPRHSAGVIFSSIDGFDMPVGIAGAQFFPQTTHIDLQSLNTFEFNHGCVACTGSTNCEVERLSVNLVEDFLEYDSLAFTYLHQSMELIPNWLTMEVLPSGRIHDFRSYLVYLVYSDALNRVQECNGLTALTDGLYSILVYTGNLEVMLDEETRQYTSNGSMVCFATNLCEGSRSPLYVSISADAHTILDSFGFMRDLRSKGWNILVNNLIISHTNAIPIFDEVSQLSYWNGIDFISPNLQNPNMITKLEFTKSFPGNSGVEAKWNFIGNVQWFHEDFNDIFRKDVNYSWDGYLNGTTELNINVSVYGAISTLKLLNDTSPSLLLASEIDDGFRCHGCPNPKGFALKLVYQLAGFSTGLFSVMLAVPPENLYGQRTQFSCPLDAFMFLNNDHDLEAVSVVSSCLDINLRFFPILDLQTNIYIFDECKISPFCTILSSEDANLIVWSEFPESISELNLGHFLKLLPVSTSNRTGLVATFSRNADQLKARLFNVTGSLFDTTFYSMVTIDTRELRFNKLINLYNRYPTEIIGSIEQTRDWNSASLEIFGNFEKISNYNIPELLCNQIEAYINILYNRSQARVQNAEIVFNRTRSRFAAAEMTHMEREIAKNESSNQIQQTRRELMRINNNIQSISSELGNANNEVTNLMNQINELCTTMECPEICIPQQVCEPCVRDVGALMQGTCTVSCTRTETVTEITGLRLVYRWEYIRVSRCYYICYCIRRWWRSICYADVYCKPVYICSLVAFYTPIVEQVTREVPSVCNVPCSAVSVRAPIMAQCCANVGCSRREQDTNCLMRNQLCENTRNAVYENLAEEQRNASIILQSLDEARANQRAVLLRLMRYEANYNFTRRQFNESLQALDEARAALDIATSSLDRVKRETKLDMLANIQNVGACRLPSSYFEVESVSFRAVIVTESPTILPLDITMFFPSSNRTVTETVNLDFYRFNMSLQQAAVIVTNSILNQRLSKRHTRNAVNISTEDENYLHFQSRCTDIDNILSYFRELNNSIFTVAETVISSMAELDQNMREISNLIDLSSANLTQSTTIDAQAIADITNKDVADIRTVNNTNTSKEVSELLNLMREHLSNGERLAKSLDNNLFQSWQVKMEDLHNQTESAAGFSCFGFSDCLQEVVDTLTELVNDIPSSSVALLSALPDAAKDLLDLALLENYSIISAVKKTLRIYSIANDSVLRDYWCAGPPKIITQPVMNITLLENTTIELSCKVEVEQFTTYQWRKDCVQLPNQRNSTLVLSNVKLSDSGNYTCVVTNQASSTTSINSSVEVHQFPAFFLEPDNADVYLGDSNGAVFQSNATGFPFPGFRWYFQPKGRKGFTQLPDEDENELVIPAPLPKDEGSYYCEAFNKQGILRSRIVNLTVLDSSVLRTAQTIYINFTRTSNLEDLNDEYDQSGSGFDALTSTTTMRLKDNLIETLKSMISFNSTSLENVTVSSSSVINITISFTLYSKYIDYPETPLSEIIQLAPLARAEWGPVWERLQLLLGSSELFITDDEENEYVSNPSSVTLDVLQDACPAGKTVSTINNLLCVSCPPGTYQTPVLQRMVDDDGRVLQQITSECVSCSTGYYQDEQGQTTCKQCPVGYTTDTTGGRFKSNCIKLCFPGNFSENGLEPCKPCPSGMYSIGMGSTSCFNCNDEVNRKLCPDLCEKCQHLCLNNSSCACHDGYTLSSDGYSCIECAKVFIDDEGVVSLKPTWHVALCNISDPSDPLVCSGSLINDQWAITSARCVCGHNIDINSLSLRINKERTCVVEEDNEIDIFASQIYCHPGYNNSDDELTDLALIRMSSPIQKDELNNTLPLCVHNNETHRFLATYGLGNPTQVVSPRAVLSPAFVSLTSQSQCFQEFLKEEIDYKNNPNVFCTGADSNSKCIGNPGSAVISFDGGSGKITFVGVISRFTKVCGKTQSHTANVQIQSSDVLQWIDDTIAENN